MEFLNIKHKDDSEDDENATDISEQGVENIYSHFVKRLTARNWFSFWGPVTDSSCELCGMFLMDALLSGQKEVNLLICSGGGSEDDSRALTGVIELCKSSGMIVKVYGAGCVASAAFDIFISCSKGYRFAFEVTMFMTHSSSGDLASKDLMKLSEVFDEWTLKKYTGIHAATRRRFMHTGDWYFSPEEAIDYGIVDYIVKAGQKLPPGPIYPKRKSPDQQKQEAAKAAAED